MRGTTSRRRNPVKPDYRRNQFGGMFGGPVVNDRTFFFADYQGQRQAIGRTVTSTVPTLLSGRDLQEAIGGRVQDIYDPATRSASMRSRSRTTRFRRAPWIPVALSLLERYPLPTNTGTANNYSRTANEIDDQDQWDVRIDHRFATGRDRLFGRLTYFRDASCR